MPENTGEGLTWWHRARLNRQEHAKSLAGETEHPNIDKERSPEHDPHKPHKKS